MFSKLAVVAFAATAAAGPVNRWVSKNDANLLTVALNLELLEENFFYQGLQNYSTGNVTFEELGPQYLELTKVHYQQEKKHVETIQQYLYRAGGKTVKACKYEFSTFDAFSFNALAQSITAVGEAALLGALGQFQYPQDYLPLIGPILGVEARQNTIFRVFDEYSEEYPSEVYNGLDFDTALTGSQALSLAAGFIHHCPSSNPPLFKSQGGCFERFPVMNTTQEPTYEPLRKRGGGPIVQNRNATIWSPVPFAQSYVYLVYELSSTRVPLHNVHNFSSKNHTAEITVPGHKNGTFFVINSDCTGSHPMPVPDDTVKAIGLLNIF